MLSTNWFFILNSSNPNSFIKIYTLFLNIFEKFIGTTPKPTIETHHNQPQHLEKKYPIFDVDAQNREDLAALVERDFSAP